MVLVLACVATFAIGVGLGLLLAPNRPAELAQAHERMVQRLNDHEQRITLCEQEQALREVLVADACTKVEAAAKRIQTRLKPASTTPNEGNGASGESVLDLRNRLKR